MDKLSKVLLALQLLFLQLLPVWTSSAVPSLTLSSRLYVGDTMVSPSKQFELGIFQFPGPKYRLGIRYALPIEQVVVWVANRDVDLSDHSYLELTTPDGNLQVVDPASNPNKPSWSSNTASIGVQNAQLLDTGNLALVDRVGKQVWDSFKNSSVTDTLLPGQYMYRASNINLTSWKTKDDPTSGPYIFGWGMRANVSSLILQLAWTSRNTFMNWTGGTYIPAPDVHNPRIISDVEFLYFHPNSGNLYIKSSPADTAILSGGDTAVTTKTLKRLTIDTDGGFRIWQWKVDSGQKTWAAVANWVVNERLYQCTTFATCGQFGWCISPMGSLDRVHCNCTEGFKPLIDSDPTQGCTPKVPLNGQDCGNSTIVKLVELLDADMPWGGDYKNLTGVDSANCQPECLKDCKCIGAVYSRDEQMCWMKQGFLYNLGYPTKVLHGTDRTAYIKISRNQPNEDKAEESTQAKWIKWSKYIIAPVAGGLMVLVCIIPIFWHMRRFCFRRNGPEPPPHPAYPESIGHYEAAGRASPPLHQAVEMPARRQNGESV